MIAPGDDLRLLRGIGEQRAKLLNKIGAKTVLELASMFPRDYEDRTVFKSISELTENESVCVTATITNGARMARSAAGREYVRARVADDTGVLEVIFFNQPYVVNMLRSGQRFVFYGRAERGNGGIPCMINPVFERADTEKSGTRTGGIIPLYRLTAGLTQQFVSGAVRTALDSLDGALPEVTPRNIREEYGLCEIRFAYENAHFPKNYEALALARQRLIFDELLTLAVASGQRRAARDLSGGFIFDASCMEMFIKALPFTLTDAQTRAIEEAVKDTASGTVMNRLIQGDVGSGKTAVAMALCYLSAKNGVQAAFMAPTELLAEQHYRTFSRVLEPLGVNIALFKGGMKKRERTEALERLRAGEISVAVGTHALISDSVTFKKLALVVTDEQHRFGVAQRAKLSAKGEKPHVLVMSATPIPRTLAIILYGDLDISVINELPPGRQAVKTYVVGEKYRERIYAFTRRLVSEGRQAYYICPAVEDASLMPGLTSVKEHAKMLAEVVFPDLEIGMVHGAMRPKEKENAMERFASGECKVLVATTVVEVGVDVPNAALIVVENADRYGLSQLHQLRGRVGRGEHESYCVLFEGAGGDVSKKRLETLCATNDGFKIAEQDLKQRGPGDFFGRRQHGLPSSRFSDALTETDAVLLARSASDKILRDDSKLEKDENRSLRNAVETLLSSAEGTFN